MTSEDVYLALTKSEDDLEHYGVPGMKWGIRKDAYSARKSEGSKKKAKSSIKSIIGRIKSSREVARKAKESVRTSAKWDKTTKEGWNKAYKRRGSYSDEDLKKMVERLKLENQLREQMRIAYPEKQKVFDKDLVKSLLKKSPEIMKETKGLINAINNINSEKDKKRQEAAKKIFEAINNYGSDDDD